MKYLLLDQIRELIEQKLVVRRGHPRLPIWIYNYSASAQFLPISEWTEALCDCRGLILDSEGEIVARPFRKFWNYAQVQDRIPTGEPFEVFEKIDGSLGIVCTYDGKRVVATRGSFESDQAKWLGEYLDSRYREFRPRDQAAWLFEIVYPKNRIVVDYGSTAEAFLLSVMKTDGTEDRLAQEWIDFRQCRRFDGITDFAKVNSDPRFAGQEGFVVRWASGFRAKVKLDEYVRLHRLITQCSTRTIWDLLRSGKGTGELIERVPDDFRNWVSSTSAMLIGAHAAIMRTAQDSFLSIPVREPRKYFAEYAKRAEHPSLIFSLLDGRPISDAAWKIVEPKWETPFRKSEEG